jgi:hypothetical protein
MVRSGTALALGALYPLLSGPVEAAPVPVKIVPGEGITRGGQPYFVRGAGGSQKLDQLARRGGNSLRTWSTDGLGAILDEAQKHGLTVCAGIWLEPECEWFSYAKPEHCTRQLERVTKAVQEHRDHPALLFWGLGNEQEGDGKNKAYWKQLNALSRMVHREDPAHPAFTALAGMTAEKAAGMNEHAPDLDFAGINTYGALPGLRGHLTKVKWNRPWVVTEYGPQGFWERPRAEWGAPLEQTSTEKAAAIRASYQKAIAPGGDCWGGYAFLWGQKQEATATWFGMFTPEGESTAVVDVLEEVWTGKAPANRAPDLAALQLSAVQIKPDSTFTATASASDPDNDSLSWHWSMCPESAGRDAKGREKTPDAMPQAVVKSGKSSAELRAPAKPGAYRVFLRVTDGKGHAGTANAPFLVKP